MDADAESEVGARLDDVTTEEILVELRRRFQHGMLMCKVDVPAANGESVSEARVAWGDVVWGLGAAQMLSFMAARRSLGWE